MEKWLHSLTLEEFVNDEIVNFPKEKVYLFEFQRQKQRDSAHNLIPKKKWVDSK